MTLRSYYKFPHDETGNWIGWSGNSDWGLAQLCTATTEAAPPFVTFEGWVPTMVSGDFARVNFDSRVESMRKDGDRRDVLHFANRIRRCPVQMHRSFVGSRSLCARLRFLRMTTGNSRFLTGLSAQFGMTSPFGRRRFASAAEAGLHFLRRFTARLKAAPFQNTVLCGTAEAVPFPVKVKIKINVKSVGQECPTHTGH